MTDRIRTTISLTPEVHAVFVRMAEAGGLSVSRCMGDWLADTVEGAQFVAMKMEEARKAPKTVMREMRSMAVGLLDQITADQEAMRRGAVGGRAGRGDAAQRASAPSSPTGLKSPRKSAGKPSGAL